MSGRGRSWWRRAAFTVWFLWACCRQGREHERERARGERCCDCDVLLAPGAGRPVAHGYGAYADAPGARCERCYTLHWGPRLQVREAARRAIQDRHACGTEDSEERRSTQSWDER